MDKVSSVWLKVWLLVAALVVPSVAAALDFLAATPVGSWQVREEATTDHKGRQSVAVVRTSMVGQESRGADTHYWIEVELTNYQVKKGKRKQQGERSIIKVLVAEAALTRDPGDVMTNLRGIGSEIIMQTGDQQPMRISGGGAMADAMLQAMGTQMEYDFQQGGAKEVTVPAGTFKCEVQRGSGYTEMKVMFKTFRVESEAEMCFSTEVPFGIVASQSKNTTNGDTSATEVTLLEFGASGAESKISGEPSEAPSLPNLFN
ncbi:hypothetical protein QWI17_16330 [Gilvimarinus sp. SDUM040013]|uniref:DUF4412 domain-containing protein n=1 Tax=Gilvimarinus gilvus TaxID=3058038 RepID=A0ABU4S085_9GAMM|nr:hypothetical protein [Gilvimarinus sp. SDUM040013]MDO3387410.1 hypothetical protein [Gilvimarinus sp. SDUM040013]MDX6849887.1 hypothetical protein [Gilvimarinus sp. SDUM040013]